MLGNHPLLEIKYPLTSWLSPLPGGDIERVAGHLLVERPRTSEKSNGAGCDDQVAY